MEPEAREGCARRRGVALSDVLAAVVLLAVALLPMISVLITSTDALGRAVLHERATALAVEVMEEQMALPYASLAAQSDQTHPYYPDMTYTVALEPHPADSGTQIVRVSVAWSWRGERRVFQLASYRSDW